MIALLRQIVAMLGDVLAAISKLQASEDANAAAIEHLRVLIEGETQPTVTGIAVKEGNQ